MDGGGVSRELSVDPTRLLVALLPFFFDEPVVDDEDGVIGLAACFLPRLRGGVGVVGRR